MTHLPDITPEQALAVLLKGAKLQQGPKSRTPLLEAVIGIGKDHHAYIGLQQEDIDALAKVLEDQTLQQSPGSAQQTEAQTVRTELKDGHVVALESYRPKQNAGGSTAKELREYALGEFAPFLELAEQGPNSCVGRCCRIGHRPSQHHLPGGAVGTGLDRWDTASPAPPSGSGVIHANIIRNSRHRPL